MTRLLTAAGALVIRAVFDYEARKKRRAMETAVPRLDVTVLRGWLKASRAANLGLFASSGQDPAVRELVRRNRLLEQENEVLRRAAAYLSQAHIPKN